MIMPNFLIIGAAKTGTTSLYRYLRQHPQIYMSPSKEPRFFALENTLLDFRGPGDFKETAKTNLVDYQNLFQSVKDEIAIGEASTIYLWNSKAPERIYHHIPDVKLIAMLRNPVDRAYSNFLHLVQEAREPLTDFMQAIQAEEKRVQENWWPFWYYKDQGYYGKQLKRYFSLFSRTQIKVYIYEEYKQNSSLVIQDIFNFLDVDPGFVPDMTERSRVSRSTPKNQFLDYLLTQPNLAKSIVKRMLPTIFRKKLAEDLKQKNLVKSKPSFHVRQLLMNEYREDILELQQLIERDLSMWLT